MFIFYFIAIAARSRSHREIRARLHAPLPDDYIAEFTLLSFKFNSFADHSRTPAQQQILQSSAYISPHQEK